MSNADNVMFLTYLVLVVALLVSYFNQGGFPPKGL